MKNKVGFRRIAGIVLVCSILFGAQPVFAAIKIFEEPGVDTLASQDIRSAAVAFEQLLKEEMGTELRQDVSLYICPDRDSYLRVRQREFREKKDVAEKADKTFGGVWYNQSGFGVIIMDLSNPALKTGQDRVSSVGRQLFYQAIYQWAGDDFTKKALQWLAEGTANLVGSRVGEMTGYESVEKWKLDRFNTLRNIKRAVSPQEIVQRNPESWLKFINEGRHPGEVADLMVFFLMKQKGLPMIADYFQKVPVESSDRSFVKAFGMEMGQFLSDYQAWYILAMGEPAKIQFNLRGNVSEENRAYYEKGGEMVRQLVYDAWNAQLKDALRVVLTENRDEYVSTMAREFGLSREQAAGQAKNEFWTDRGSVVVMNVEAMPEPEDKIYQIAFVVGSRLIAETGGAKNMDNMKWLSYGAASVLAARSAERSGFARYGDFQGSWEYGLARSRSWASPAQLMTLANWSVAAEKHGPAAVRGVSALSTHYLADKFGGYPQLGAWMKETKKNNDPATAFAKIYGMTVSQLWERARDFVEPYRGGWTPTANSASEETE